MLIGMTYRIASPIDLKRLELVGTFTEIELQVLACIREVKRQHLGQTDIIAHRRRYLETQSVVDTGQNRSASLRHIQCNTVHGCKLAHRIIVRRGNGGLITACGNKTKQQQSQPNTHLRS